MPGLTAIDLATDEELTNYESEIVLMAADRGLSLAKYRASAMTRLRMEALKDGIDEDLVLDDPDDKRSLALRDYATRLVIYYFWRDQSAGLEESVTTAKARLARDDANDAAALFKEIGWPGASGGSSIVKDVDQLPRVIEVLI